MTTAHNSLGRFQVVEGSPPNLPGKCVVCGTTNAKFFIDIGFDLDFYGTIYFCDTCYLEGANSLGYRSPAQWGKLQELQVRTNLINVQLTEQIEEFKNALGSLKRLGISSDSDPASWIESAPEVLGEILQGDNQEADGDESNPDAEQSGSPEQTNEPGRPDVQYDDSLDDFILGDI